jgi:hypothetical protein
MTPDDKTRFERYEDLWVQLNAVNGLIDDLLKRREDIKIRQRQLANAIVSARMEELRISRDEVLPS